MRYNPSLRGVFAERLAINYFHNKGYELMARNFHHANEEIDLVFAYFGEVVFVEVKFRNEREVATGAEAVHHFKRRRLLMAARAFLKQHYIEWWPYRFDVLELYIKENDIEYSHYRYVLNL